MTGKYVKTTYITTDTYKNILLNAKDAKAKIESSNDDTTKLVFFEKKREPYKFFIQDNTLTIKSTKTKWYHFLKIGVNHSEIRLCVPKTILQNISVRSNIGNVDISSIICDGSIDIQTGTGNTILENVTCKDFGSRGNTGFVSLDKVIAKESILIKRNTGKVILKDCSAPEFFVKTNTGKVCGKLPSNTIFIARTNTGKIKIPPTPVGENIGRRCEIKTNTGNIMFE